MKVLIVESNIVMTEIISDVLSVDGFTVATAANADDAEAKFKSFEPNVVVFDVDMKDANVLNFISLVKEDNVRIIAVCNSIADAPSHKMITDYIVKPFKSSEILMAVRKAKTDLETRNKKMRKFSNILTGIFGKKKETPSKDSKGNETVTITPKKIERPYKEGKSYLVIEQYPKEIYEIGRSYIENDSNLMILTTGTIKYARAIFPETNATIYGLSKRAKDGYFAFSKIGSIVGEVGEFSKDNVNGVVILEGVEDMIECHGMSTVVTMICQLVDNGMETGTVFLFSVRPKTFSENEKNLLLHHLEIYGMEGANEKKEGSQ